MRRIASGLTGLALIAIAFVAAGQVADTRDGLIAEVVTLLAGLAGVGLLLYGLIPKRSAADAARGAPTPRPDNSRRTANDLLAGSIGIAIAAIMLGGLLLSGGPGWAAMGGLLLIPLIAGSIYLLVVFARARERDWSIDLRRLFKGGG